MPVAEELQDLSGAERLKALVDNFAQYPESVDLRERVRSLLPVLYELRAVGKALLPEDADLSGCDRVLTYLRYPLTVIEGDELLLISRIGDWARRVRELRIQLGWRIFSRVTLEEMAPDAPESADQLASELSMRCRSRSRACRSIEVFRGRMELREAWSARTHIADCYGSSHA